MRELRNEALLDDTGRFCTNVDSEIIELAKADMIGFKILEKKL